MTKIDIQIRDLTTKSFNQTNSTQMENLLKPMKERFEEFRSKVEEIHVRDSKERGALGAELRALKELNLTMNDQARRLTLALRNEPKTKGRWGEMALENILEGSGLRPNKDYKKEVSMRSSSGKYQRPDIIIYLPQNKHLVIDAKVSLDSYERLTNTETELERKEALKELAAEIDRRIKELSDRTYYDLPGLNTPEVVFMFIPLEAAYIEVFKADEFLAQRAVDSNVLITSPTTLLASLRIVHQLWRFEEQNKEQANFYDRAGKIYNKLCGFLSDVEKIGVKIEEVKAVHSEALNKLFLGKGNLISQAKQFEKLGVVAKSKLPDSLVSKADIELPEK